MGLEDAFHHPRIDVSGGDTVIADDSLPEATLAAVRAQHAVVTTRRAPYPYAFASPAGVLHEEGGGNWGATEPFSPCGAGDAAGGSPTSGFLIKRRAVLPPAGETLPRRAAVVETDGRIDAPTSCTPKPQRLPHTNARLSTTPTATSKAS